MLSERLKTLRTTRKKTQSDFAKIIGVARTTYAMYEQGQREPDYVTLQKIADYYEVSIDYLLGRSENPNLTNYNKKGSNDLPSQGDEAEFEKWVNDPSVDKFYREFKESPEERKKALLAVWEIIKKQEK